MYETVEMLCNKLGVVVEELIPAVTKMCTTSNIVWTVIWVDHEVPYDKGLESKCYYAGGFDGNEVCKYHKFRN